MDAIVRKGQQHSGTPLATQCSLDQSGSAQSAYWIVVLCDGDVTRSSTNPPALQARIHAKQQTGKLGRLIAIIAGKASLPRAVPIYRC